MRHGYQEFLRELLVIIIAAILTGVTCLGLGLIKVGAQDEAQQVNTGFMIWCDQGDPARTTFIVQSNGVEDYDMAIVGGPAETTIPTHFTTHSGTYLLGWVDNSNWNVQEVHFTNSQGFDGVMLLRYDYMTFCGHDVVLDLPDPASPPEPEPTATPAETCERTAYDSGTGHVYCYRPLPGGVVPIPPGPNG